VSPVSLAAAVAAVIDIGSNSVLLLTVAVERGRARVLDQALAVTRLGTGLRPGGRLDADALARTRDAAVAFAARARARGAPRVWAFATAALREAADGSAAAGAIAAAAGVPVEVLSGEREAALAYAAVAAATRAGGAPLLVADVGGRTTELTLGVGERVLCTVSLPLGALALTEAHGADLGRAGAAVGAVLAAGELPAPAARARAAGARLAASGGTVTALAALDLGLGEYVPRRVHGHVLARAALAGLMARLARMTAAERAALPGLDPGRGAILPAGALVLERIAGALGADRIVVSDHGVRHAYLHAALARDGLPADFGELWP
jgi:exopolyphosphatase/guanosine-5'-triphosphate,3'-diphosphate pyrophosphatase